MFFNRGFLGGSLIKNPSAHVGDAGDVGSIPGLGRSPGEGNGNSLQYSCLGNPMDKSLAGYSPRSHKKLDTTEHACTHACVSQKNSEETTREGPFSIVFAYK